ncbi:ATPase [Streptomyces violaceusniger]|uniref:MoxR family ATPase n=2 Tax=Streptomyces violaceusniger group TaxID=2839105 RepID=A0ABD5JL47_9ACTN|nr:MoxR family ATPase [Streptomyces violaceusniger]KUL66759.1 ATPase [Streptomyces violaceusniger]MEE4589145.1 MoxR family ATPase [Streptomyces sp. DSM 41602]
MTWSPCYRGNGEQYQGNLPAPPSWRFAPPKQSAERFRPPLGLAEAVNAALSLRRPLLLTGSPGTGKSTVATSVAYELCLGDVLHWHITSRSTLTEALYRYDALGRLDATRHGEPDDIGRFLQLGPLGTALMPRERPRMLLIDEIDKSDIDLPSDLLNVIETGEFEIPELTRHAENEVHVRLWDGDEPGTVSEGRVKCTQYPFIVMTSNGERGFPPPFLRRCVRFEMPDPDAHSLAAIVRAHLGEERAQQAEALLSEFEARLQRRESLATDQLLNALHLVTGDVAPDDRQRARLVKLLLRDLSTA